MLPSGSFLAVFIFSFVIGMGAVVSPGPVSTAIVSQAPRRGWLAGPLVATGHSVTELIIVLFILLGLGSVLAHPAIQTQIAILGGLLLLWMGASMILSTWRGKVHLPQIGADVSQKSSPQLVGLGMLATVSNPFWYAWWVTVAAGYLAQAKIAGIAAVGAFYLGHVSADYLWDTTLSAVVGGGRRWMTDHLYQGILVLCAAFFIYLGFVFLLQGIQTI